MFPAVTNPTSPDWPEQDDDSDDAEVVRHVWRSGLAAVSKAAQTGRKGSVQQLLAADPHPSKMIVCTTKIGDTPQKAIYVSADKESIMIGLAMPRTTRLTTLTAEIADDFKYAIEQNGSLKKALNEQMERGSRRHATLPGRNSPSRPEIRGRRGLARPATRPAFRTQETGGGSSAPSRSVCKGIMTTTNTRRCLNSADGHRAQGARGLCSATGR